MPQRLDVVRFVVGDRERDVAWGQSRPSSAAVALVLDAWANRDFVGNALNGEEELLKLVEAGCKLDALVAGQVDQHVAQDTCLVVSDLKRGSEKRRGSCNQLAAQRFELPEMRGVWAIEQRVDAGQQEVDVLRTQGDRALRHS